MWQTLGSSIILIKEIKDMEELLEFKRPGGKLAARPLHFIWMVDCSGSMTGEKIESLNYAIRQVIPEMRSAASENPNAELLVRTIKFSHGASWHGIPTPTPIDQFVWDNLTPGGETQMGKAFELLTEQLKMPPMPERALPPVIVLLSDGQPTDEYRNALSTLNSIPWGKRAVKIAIAIGHDADKMVLEEFVNNPELPVLEANNPEALVKYIKWASTVAKQVSAPFSKSTADGGSIITNVDAATIPTVSDDDDVW